MCVTRAVCDVCADCAICVNTFLIFPCVPFVLFEPFLFRISKLILHTVHIVCNLEFVPSEAFVLFVPFVPFVPLMLLAPAPFEKRRTHRQDFELEEVKLLRELPTGLLT